MMFVILGSILFFTLSSIPAGLIRIDIWTNHSSGEIIPFSTGGDFKGLPDDDTYRTDSDSVRQSSDELDDKRAVYREVGGGSDGWIGTWQVGDGAGRADRAWEHGSVSPSSPLTSACPTPRRSARPIPSHPHSSRYSASLSSLWSTCSASSRPALARGSAPFSKAARTLWIW